MVPGLVRSSGEGKSYPLQYSGLENSIDYIVHAVTKRRTLLSDFHFQSDLRVLSFSSSHNFLTCDIDRDKVSLSVAGRPKMSKEINPACSLEGLTLKLKLQSFGHLMHRADSLGKTLMLGKMESKGRRGDRRRDG